MWKLNIKNESIIAGRNLAAFFFFCALFSLILYKAIYVPITHDEKSASVYYPTFTIGQIMMYPDNWPSNHILNSLAIKGSESIFGIEPWSVRLPNVIAFVFFFGVMYTIARQYFNESFFFFLLPMVIIFSNPFLIDFFGLARGYGMSNTFMAASVYCLLRYVSMLRLRWYFFSILLSMLAAYANFTLLIYWVAIHAVLVTIFLLNSIKTQRPLLKIAATLLFTIIIAATFLALCYQPLYKMQSTNQFVYWSKSGFFADTLVDQVRNFGYNNNSSRAISFLSYTVIVTFCIAGAIVLMKFLSRGYRALSDPLTVLFMLLLVVWIINMAQTILLGTPYLTTRTGLSYYVLFSFVLMFLIRDISYKAEWIRIYLAPAIVILFLSHQILVSNLTSVREWWYDANTYQVINYMRDYKKEHPAIEKVELNTNWLFNPSFTFYTITGKLPWLMVKEYHKEVDTTSQTLFYYATGDDLPFLKQYQPVLKFDGNARVLLIKK